MLKIGDYEIDNERFPPAITDRLLQRAVAHILNNECAASVLGKIKRQIAGADGKIDTVTQAQVDTFRETQEAIVAALEDEFRQAKIAAMYDGTLSVRAASGPSRDPVEAAARGIAKAEVTTVLKQHSLKFPGKDEVVTLAGTEYDADALVERRLGHPEHGPRIKTAAERKVREAKRLREQSAKATASAGDVAAELGL